MSTDDVAIRVENLGKMYRIYDKPADRLKQMLCGRFRNGGYGREFWALHGINLSIKKGETVGIVGRNGSGKSTLLQMLAAGLSATTGTIQINGRIAALLELGSGFNPEFTGRENIFLNAAVLGVSRELVENRITDILAFAEISEFIDQPVRTYSSGMVVRLAFAVAIHVDADILIVDEALAVGDEFFCRKCFGKIKEFQGRGGTILFVTHSVGLVVELCTHAILFDHGEMLCQGPPKLVTALYQKLSSATPDRVSEVKRQILANTPGETQSTTETNPQTEERPPPSPTSKAFFDSSLKATEIVTYDNRGAEVHNPRIENTNKEKVNCLVFGEEYFYCYRVRFLTEAHRVRFGMLIKSTTGLEIAGATSLPESDPRPDYISGDEVDARFRWRCLLHPGVYFINAGIQAMKDEIEFYLNRYLDIVAIRVQPKSDLTTTGMVGLVSGCVVSISKGDCLSPTVVHLQSQSASG